MENIWSELKSHMHTLKNLKCWAWRSTEVLLQVSPPFLDITVKASVLIFSQILVVGCWSLFFFFTIVPPKHLLLFIQDKTVKIKLYWDPYYLFLVIHVYIFNIHIFMDFTNYCTLHTWSQDAIDKFLPSDFAILVFIDASEKVHDTRLLMIHPAHVLLPPHIKVEVGKFFQLQHEDVRDTKKNKSTEVNILDISMHMTIINQISCSSDIGLLIRRTWV